MHDQDSSSQHNARIGLVLFGVYLTLYAGFVLLNAFAADVMEKTPIAGLNVAILYGFGLIIGALVMALLYGAMCKIPADSKSAETGSAASSHGVSQESDA